MSRAQVVEAADIGVSYGSVFAGKSRIKGYWGLETGAIDA